MSVLLYTLPVLIAGLGLVASAYTCWDRTNHRPTKVGLVVMVGIASLTVLHLWTSNFLQDIEKRRLAGLAIAQHDINDEFEFWESRSQEAIRGDFTFFGSREQFISQMRGALYFGAEEIKGHKQRLIDGGVDRQMVEDLHGVMVASQPDARTIPEDGLAPFIEYTMRNTRQRLEKEILRAQAD